jgi:hypothetical protein
MAEANPGGDHSHVHGKKLFATIVVGKATKEICADFTKERLQQNKARKPSGKVRQIQH